VYTQGQEERFILDALGGHIGRFLDIGAFHPKVFSATRALYELGWSGVMIEPSPGPFRALMDEYGNDDRIELICAAIGKDRGLKKFYSSDDAIGTLEREHFDKWSKHAKYNGSFWVPTLTISDILEQFGAFEFVNIDTEGISASICLDLAKSQMRPRCICVEHDGRQAELLDAWQQRGYRPLLSNAENLVFAL
jgi:FkbM family methyltransferase